jgi:hypothetical protein
MTQMMKDRNGYAPRAENQCDAHEECFGWELCHHPLSERTEGHEECPVWCGVCDEGVDGRGPVWTWCPERQN